MGVAAPLAAQSYDWVVWLGNLNEVPILTPHLVGVIGIAVSGLCGGIVGIDRERRHKPAGLRTLILICVGSTIYTLAAMLLTSDHDSRGTSGWRPDPGRIPAQVVTGIGFLGAGAIIHARRTVVGVTTGASIWVVAAIGVVVGIGYAAAGLVLACVIFLILSAVRVLDLWLAGPCHWKALRLHFRGGEIKGRYRVIGVLDDFNPARYAYRIPAAPTPQSGQASRLELRYCSSHSHHRAFLPEIVALAELESIEEIEW